MLSKGELAEATALRYLPADLELWKKNPRSERLLLVSTSGDPYGIEAELSAAAADQGLTLTVLPDAGPTDRAEAMFAALRRETDTPGLLLAASTDARIQKLCQTLGALAEVPVVALKPHMFPLAVADGGGKIMVFQSSREFLPELLRHSADRDPFCFSSHNADTGWSRVWKIIERRVQAPQLVMLGEQREADAVALGGQRDRGAARAVSSPATQAGDAMLDRAHA
jgi:hypothetical protein